jgi:hypothetical protein
VLRRPADDCGPKPGWRYHRAAMAETTQTVEERLQDIGTQLAWVRDYL